jgi:hypothetical protein
MDPTKFSLCDIIVLNGDHRKKTMKISARGIGFCLLGFKSVDDYLNSGYVKDHVV